MSLRSVILVNLGTPQAPSAAAVRTFLAEFLADPMVVDWPRWLWLPILKAIVLTARPRRVARQYRSIWGAEGSPLEVGTRRIAEGLAKRLGPGYRVAYAYRYGTPSFEQRLEQMLADLPGEGPTGVAVVPLFPQPTGATTGSIERVARQVAARRSHNRRASLQLVLPPPTDPGFVEALAARCRAAFDRQHDIPEHLLISFHGIPLRFDRGEQHGYSRACELTAHALLRALDWDPSRSTLCYQSRFGPERWLEPTTANLLQSLPRRGVGRVAVVCPGFLADGLETLEEIGIRGRETLLAAGGSELILVPAVEDHPAMLRCLAEAVARGGPEIEPSET